MRRSLLWCVPLTTALLSLTVAPAVHATARTAGPAVTTAAVTASAAVLAATGDAYVPLTPAVLASDIRAQPGAPGLVTVRGRGGVLAAGAAGAGVKAVVLQVEVSGASAAGRLVAYSDTAKEPVVASLAYPRATAVSQLVVVPFAAGRQVKLAVTAGRAKLAVAVVGYYAAPGSTSRGTGFAPVQPERVATVGPLGNGVTGVVRVAGIEGIPTANDSAVVAEVSAVNPAAAGTLTVYPAGTAKPAVPSVAFAAGAGSASLVIVPANAAGKFAVTDSGGAAKVTVDVLGYFPGYGVGVSSFVPAPVTRAGRAVLAAGRPQSVKVTGTSVVPAAGAETVLLTVIASGATKSATVTAYPAGQKAPVATTLTTRPGGAAVGLIPVQPGASGQVTLAISAGSASVTVAAAGYYRAGPAVSPVTGLHATAVTSSSASLAWTVPAGPGPAATGPVAVRRYTGYLSVTTPTTGTEVASLPPGTASYTETGLPPSRGYTYAVFATDGQGGAAPPATLVVNTPPPPGPCTDTFTGAVSSDWDTAANWSAGVPGPADWACIPQVAQHLPVTTGPSPVTVAGFTNDGGLTVDTSQDGAYAPELTLTSAAQASTSSATLTLDGSLDAAGPVTVTGTLVPLSGRLTVPKTLTVGPLGKLQDPAQDPEAGALPPLELASGTLVNGGTGTIGARDGISVLAGATLANQGLLTADGTSVIDVADGAMLSDTGSLTTGALTIESGGGLSIDRGAVLIIGGNSVLAAGSTLFDSAPLLLDARLTVDTSVLVGQLTVEAAGTLELGPGVTVSAASTGFSGGTLQLDAQSAGNFGQLANPGKAKPGNATLNLYAPDWGPACGTTVTALSADKMLDGFGTVTADDGAPGTATWSPEETATTAGATLTCP